MIRYAITVKKSIYRMRHLATANQGRNFFDTFEDASNYLDLVKGINNPDTLKQIWGEVESLRIDPIECFENGDAKGIYIRTNLLFVTDCVDQWEVMFNDPDKLVYYPKKIMDQIEFGVWLYDTMVEKHQGEEFAIIHNK